MVMDGLLLWFGIALGEHSSLCDNLLVVLHEPLSFVDCILWII
jgi:hypothetical protein